MATMSDRIGTGLLLGVVALVSLTSAGCVPNPGGLADPSAASGTDAAVTAAPTPSGPTPTPSFTRPTPTPLPTFLVYVVQSGDSLEGIGDRFGTSGRSIAQWNRFSYPSLDPLSDDYEPDRIVVGWTLRLIPGLEYDPEELPGPTR